MACAQVYATGVADADVQTALGNLRQDTSLFLRLQGQVAEGTNLHTITCDDYWSSSVTSSGNPFNQNELLEYYDSNLISRSVADGTTLWHYNLLKDEYRTGLYGRYDTSVAPNYLRDLLDMLQTFSNGYSAFTVKLLSQADAGTGATFKNWVPGATGVETAVPTDADPTLVDVTYAVGSPIRRYATFHLDGESGSLQLTSIDYFDQSAIGGQPRVVTWTLTPYAVLPSSANFVPYTAAEISGWLPVANEH